MAEPILTPDNFSHVSIGVSSMDDSLAFYRDLLGMEVIFDRTLGGEALERVTGQAGASARMAGLIVPGTGVLVQLMAFGVQRPEPGSEAGSGIGYSNMSFHVADLAGARDALEAAGATVGPLVDFDGIGVFFVVDPDGTRIEIVEYPGAATTHLEHQLAKG